MGNAVQTPLPNLNGPRDCANVLTYLLKLKTELLLLLRSRGL